MSTSPTVEQVNSELKTVQDPEIHKPITDLGMVKDVAVDPGPCGFRCI